MTFINEIMSMIAKYGSLCYEEGQWGYMRDDSEAMLRPLVLKLEEMERQRFFWEKACDDAHNLGAERFDKVFSALKDMVQCFDVSDNPDHLDYQVWLDAKATIEELK